MESSINIKPLIPFGGDDVQTRHIEEARVLILPIYYEVAPSYGEGSGEGPFHFLTASHELETIDEETLSDWSSLGLHTLPALIPSTDPEKAISEIRQAAKTHLDTGKFLLSIGGDHAVSIGLIMAAAQIHPDIGVLQIDAHMDLRDTWHGSRYNHGCVMRRVADDMRLPFVQVGIRSFSPEEAAYVKSKGLKPFYAHNIHPQDDSWMDDVINNLPEKIYLTIDVDGLDPSVMPGTGTPVPGGLDYRQLVSLIKKIGASKKVIASDINELAKIEGTQVSEFTAAKIAVKLFVHCL
ncbi:MAG: agmatinase [Desulfobacterales bacterium]|nr:agmatinase [Desulfobacterales bacterium]